MSTAGDRDAEMLSTLSFRSLPDGGKTLSDSGLPARRRPLHQALQRGTWSAGCGFLPRIRGTGEQGAACVCVRACVCGVCARECVNMRVHARMCVWWVACVWCVCVCTYLV